MVAGPDCYKGSHSGGTILAPLTQPAGAGFAVDTVGDGGAISLGADVAACRVGGSLQSLTAQLALSLQSVLIGGQIKQPLSTVAANDMGLADGDLGDSHSHHGGDAGTGQAIGAGHDLRVWWGLLLPP